VGRAAAGARREGGERVRALQQQQPQPGERRLRLAGRDERAAVQAAPRRGRRPGLSFTPYAELDALLAELVAGAREILGDNFVGAYLHGSFAVGDADERSDVDFLVVIERELREDERRELQELHERLFRLPTHWAQHLEGSYVPRDQLRRLDPGSTPWFYFDNGATEPAWDPHDNTAVVRWSLREHGVVLAGPDPKTLVEPVSAAELRAEALAAIPEFVAWAPEPTKAGGMSRWKQPYLVLNLCRMLHTLETGAVSSKRKGGEWALEALAPEWRGLIRRALDEEDDPWPLVYEQADPEVVERTLAFVEYAAKASGGIRPAAR
jgi:predicted nucleotidyltransferase